MMKGNLAPFIASPSLPLVRQGGFGTTKLAPGLEPGTQNWPLWSYQNSRLVRQNLRQYGYQPTVQPRPAPPSTPNSDRDNHSEATMARKCQYASSVSPIPTGGLRAGASRLQVWGQTLHKTHSPLVSRINPPKNRAGDSLT